MKHGIPKGTHGEGLAAHGQGWCCAEFGAQGIWRGPSSSTSPIEPTQHWGAQGGSGGDAPALGHFSPASWGPLALAFTFHPCERPSHEKRRTRWWKAQSWLPRMGSGSGSSEVPWGHGDTVPLYQFLREVMTKKRMAWFDPCLRTVAVKPW